MQLGLTKERAEELMDLYFGLYPGIKTYIECSHNMAELNHYVFSWFGQRKMTYGAMPVFKGTAVYNGSKRLAQNVRVQNAASSFGLDCFAHFSNAIKPLGGKSLCTVYDSIEVSAPIDRAAEVIEIGFYELDDHPLKRFPWLELPVGCDAEIGFNWGDVRHVHRGITQEEILEELAKLR